MDRFFIKVLDVALEKVDIRNRSGEKTRPVSIVASGDGRHFNVSPPSSIVSSFPSAFHSLDVYLLLRCRVSM